MLRPCIRLLRRRLGPVKGAALKVREASYSTSSSGPAEEQNKKFDYIKHHRALMGRVPIRVGKDLVVHPSPENPGKVTLDLQPGRLTTTWLWLRDTCQCPKCVDPHSGQKNFSTVDLPDRPEMRSAEVLEDRSLKVIWENDKVFGEDVHESIYPHAQYQQWFDEQTCRQPEKLPTKRKHWSKATYEALLQNGITRISYRDWTNTTDRTAFWRAFEALSQTGLIFIDGVPHGEQEVERIGNQIGMLQHTFYGTTWDVKSKPEAENVAYTSQFLGLHQDLMYHDPVPRLQILHCLENSCEGGESLFSDGLRAALELREARKDYFKTLTTPAWFFGYDKDPHHYLRKHAVIQVDPETQYIESLHWAPPFQTRFQQDYAEDGKQPPLLKLKRAASLFEKILSSPRNMLEVKLNPGEAVIFDNWRIMHGRREFAAGSGGSRWLKGTYITHQVFKAVDERRPWSGNETPQYPLHNSETFRTVLRIQEEKQLARERKDPAKAAREARLEKWQPLRE